jgi:type II restriction enzyme
MTRQHRGEVSRVDMTTERRRRIEELVKKIPTLTDGQIYWIESVIRVLESPHSFKIVRDGFFNKTALEDFGDALRIHHSFSAEPFSKDKFEFVLEKVLNMSGHSASLAPRGNRGYDIVIDRVKVSLKTQADKGIQKDKIWISKFMELGKGHWGDDPKDLYRLRDLFLAHLGGYQRIMILRALEKGPRWRYELVEIPKKVLMAAASGEIEMKTDSTQFPKPGYCYVRTPKKQDMYQLYFDAGGERKLQVKNLSKKYCVVHATWQFLIPQE